MKRSGPPKRRTPLRRASWFDEVAALPEAIKTGGLQRTKRLNPRRSKPRRTEKVRDRAHLDRIKELGYCSAADLPLAGICIGPIDPDHFGARGMGQKTDDRNCFPVCRRHHDCRHAMNGPFKRWDRERMRAWAEEQIDRAMAVLELTELYGTLAGHGRRRAS